MLKTLKRGLRACLLKKKRGGVLQAAISNKAKIYLSQNYNKKINFIVRFPSALYHQTHLLMTSQNSIHHIADITYTTEIFPTYFRLYLDQIYTLFSQI